MTSQELDRHIEVELEEWLDINSARLQEMDDDPALTRWFLKLGLEGGFLQTDSEGRVFGEKEDGTYFPFHVESNGKKYGIRLATKASN